MTAFYNEIDPYAAQWLRNVIREGLIPDGEVCERSIVDLRPSDLVGFTQCHFFAGLGGWGAALRLAGWPDDRSVWTGSCPCQPFSVAGKGAGTADVRHLWPDFFRLIRACRPVVVMGEQVAGAAGYGWLDGVRSDLEGEGYASRGVDIPACSVDAPHIRSRLYWIAAADVADADQPCTREGREQRGGQQRGAGENPRTCAGGDVADSDLIGQPHERVDGLRRATVHDAHGRGERVDVGLEGRAGHGDDRDQSGRIDPQPGRSASPTGGRNGTFWSNHVWLVGADGKARRAQPGIRLLAHGIPGRVGRLRAYGNAIVPQVAAEVIAAFMEAAP